MIDNFDSVKFKILDDNGLEFEIRENDSFSD